MSNAIDAIRLICPSLWAGFYQQATAAVSFQELGNRLIKYAERAKAIRQLEHLEIAAQCLVNIPIKQYQEAGHYYLAWVTYKSGQHEQAKPLLFQYASAKLCAFSARLSVATHLSQNPWLR